VRLSRLTLAWGKQMRDIQVTGDSTNLLAELNRQGVRYLIVGGVAVRHYVPEERKSVLILTHRQTLIYRPHLDRHFASNGC
jgi:hypothetical protein